jgi:GNAT superfamily N-acetyltransferase
MTFTLQIEKPDKPEIVELIAQLDAHLKSLYPPASNHLLDIRTLMGENIVFLTAKEDERYVGCGALRLFKGEYAEVKRMYVAPSERGKQIGYRLLSELERLASEFGLNVLRLETGIRQKEALRLYEKFGFRRIPPFGEYTDDPLSLCYEKQIIRERPF